MRPRLVPMPPDGPQTPIDWQNAVDAAKGALALDSARQYGLVVGGPDVDVIACEAMLLLGAERGYTPGADAVDRFAIAIAQEHA